MGLFLPSLLATQDAPYKDPAQPIGKRVDDLLSLMTLEEKVHQLATQFVNGNVRLGVPHMKSAEALHGLTLKHGTSFPQATAMGSTWDPDLVERIATVIAAESRALGVHQVYSPMLGVLIDPRWGRSEESYSEDPFLASRIGVGFIRGLQGMGEERYGPDRIIATAKHFVADGQPMAGINASDMDASERACTSSSSASLQSRRSRGSGRQPHARPPCRQRHPHACPYAAPGRAAAEHLGIRRAHHFGQQRHPRSPRREVHRTDLGRSGSPVADRRSGSGALHPGALVREGLRREPSPRRWPTVQVSIDLIDRATRNVLRSKFALGLFDDGTPSIPGRTTWWAATKERAPSKGGPEYEDLANTTAVRGIDEPLNEYFNFLHRLGVPRDNWREVLYNENTMPWRSRLPAEPSRC